MDLFGVWNSSLRRVFSYLYLFSSFHWEHKDTLSD